MYRAPQLEAVLVCNPQLSQVGGSMSPGSSLAGSARLPAGAAAGVLPHAAIAGRLRYYARLVVNGHVVGTSGVANLGEDFTIAFRDLFRCVL